MKKKGKLYIVGIGPGNPEHLSICGKNVLKKCQVIVGYKSYLEMIRKIINNKTVIASGMGQEISRVKEAVRLAQSGKIVALISGGDAGIYGMAGPVFEVLKNENILKENYPLIEVIPGIAGLNAAAALLGAPLMHDFASISLSDLLTPWKLIEKRLHAAAQADFVLIIYNPKSKGRSWQIDQAKKIILKYRKSNTPAGIVENACREGEKIILSNLEEFTKNKIGMRSIIIIGNSHSYTLGNFMVTPRGYKITTPFPSFARRGLRGGELSKL